MPHRDINAAVHDGARVGARRATCARALVLQWPHFSYWLRAQSDFGRSGPSAFLSVRLRGALVSEPPKTRLVARIAARASRHL